MALESVDIAAGKHKEYAISKRIKNDFDYVVALAGVVCKFFFMLLGHY